MNGLQKHPDHTRGIGRSVRGWLPWFAVGFVGIVAGDLPRANAHEEPSLPVLQRVAELPVAAELLRVLPDGALEFTTADEETIQVIPQTTVRWGVARGTASHPFAITTGGGLITLSEIADPMVEFGDAFATLATLSAGRVELDRNRVRGLVFAPPSDPFACDRLLDEVREVDADHDTVRLRNGDLLTGAVEQIGDRQLHLEVDGRSLTIALERIALVIFNARLASGEGPLEAAMAVGLADGSVLGCRSLRSVGPRIRLQLAGGSEAAAVEYLEVPLAQIVYLQSAARLCDYLSSLSPVAFRHVPYLALEWPWRQNRSVIGTRLRTADGGIYLRGLGVHSACRIAYRAPDAARRFRATVALDASAGRRGSVVFRVLLATGGQWQEAFRSPIIRGGDQPLDVDVDLAGSTGVALAVDHADFGDELDRANWLDARFEWDPQ